MLIAPARQGSHHRGRLLRAVPPRSTPRDNLSCLAPASGTRRSRKSSYDRPHFATTQLIGYAAGMKTVISISNEVYMDAGRLARRVRKSRSQRFTEAVAEDDARHDPDAITEAMNRVCEALDARPDPAVSAAARRVLLRAEW